jgi:dihydrolipoamide dehydrogenase
MGKYQARLAAEHILGNPSSAEHGADGKQSPRVIFTDPQVAAVGHTEMTAREAGLDVHVLEVGTSANAGGSFYGRNAPGTARLLVDKQSDLIVGAITGAEVADFSRPPPSRSSARCRWAGCGTRRRRSRHAARSGST